MTNRRQRLIQAGVAAIIVLALPALSRADENLDRAVAGLTSKDWAVRQASVKAVHEWEDRFQKSIEVIKSSSNEEDLKAALKKLQDDVSKIREEIARYRGILFCEKYLDEAVEAAADPSPNAVRALLAKAHRYEIDEPIAEPECDEAVPTRCGMSGQGDPEHEASLFLVMTRPEVVRKMLGEPSVAFRHDLLEDLAVFGRPEDEKFVVRGLASPDPRMRGSALTAAPKFREATWLPAAVRLINDPSPMVRSCLADALSELESSVKRPILLKLLGDQYRYVAESAMFAIGEDSSPVVGRAYAKVLIAHPNWGDFVMQGLYKCAGREAIPALLAHWRKKGEAWEEIPSVLLGIDSSFGTRFVIQATRDADVERRRVAVHDLMDVKGNEVEDALLAALADPDDTVIECALVEVEKRCLADAIPILLNLLATKRGNSVIAERTLKACTGMAKGRGKE